MLLLNSNFILKSSFLGGFSIRFKYNLAVAYFLLGLPVYAKPKIVLNISFYLSHEKYSMFSSSHETLKTGLVKVN